MYYTNKCKQC